MCDEDDELRADEMEDERDEMEADMICGEDMVLVAVGLRRDAVWGDDVSAAIVDDLSIASFCDTVNQNSNW